MDVGILGGTGPAGQAVAARLAASGFAVVIGSRSVERATVACEEIRKRWPDLDLDLAPGENADAARTDRVIVATPWDAAATTAASVADELDGKVVISMANGLVKVGGDLVPVVPPEGSVAMAVHKAVPGALVTAAFHHLPAREVADLTKPVDGDVVVVGDSAEAVTATCEVIERLPDLRALHAGGLSLAGAVEEFTAVLLAINRRYKARSTIRFAGLRGPNAEGGLRGPNAEGGLRGPNAEGGLRGPNAEHGLRGPNAEHGLRGPNAEHGLRGPRGPNAERNLSLDR